MKWRLHKNNWLNDKEMCISLEDDYYTLTYQDFWSMNNTGSYLSKNNVFSVSVKLHKDKLGAVTQLKEYAENVYRIKT
jgi:hypothetical protein